MTPHIRVTRLQTEPDKPAYLSKVNPSEGAYRPALIFEKTPFLMRTRKRWVNEREDFHHSGSQSEKVPGLHNAFKPTITPGTDPLSLDLYRRAHLFELGLYSLGLVLRDSFLYGTGSPVNQRLGLLQAQAGNGSDHFDHLNFLVSDA